MTTIYAVEAPGFGLSVRQHPPGDPANPSANLPHLLDDADRSVYGRVPALGRATFAVITPTVELRLRAEGPSFPAAESIAEELLATLHIAE